MSLGDVSFVTKRLVSGLRTPDLTYVVGVTSLITSLSPPPPLSHFSGSNLFLLLLPREGSYWDPYQGGIIYYQCCSFDGRCLSPFTL